MSDINKFIGSEESADLGIQERMQELDEWSEDTARALAEQEGLELANGHWEVLHFLRDYYVQNGKTQRARQLTEALEERFRDKGGRRFLYRLFPKGPVAQGSRLAGTPVPADSVDPSFGSVQ